MNYRSIIFQTLLGYLFMPFAFLMGVDWEDTLTVGRLIGLKVTANEFLAYFVLGNEIQKGTISVSNLHLYTNRHTQRHTHIYTAGRCRIWVKSFCILGCLCCVCRLGARMEKHRLASCDS